MVPKESRTAADSLRVAVKERGGKTPKPRLADARAVAHAALKAEASAHANAVMPAVREAQAAGATSLR
jgi:hypothetical protein